jgi:hypothetical protein
MEGVDLYKEVGLADVAALVIDPQGTRRRRVTPHSHQWSNRRSRCGSDVR